MIPRRIRSRSRGSGPKSNALIVYRWDLDKTYLRSDFDSVRRLLRVPFEGPEDKVEVPGVIELIRSLKPCAERAARAAQILFLSASPPQIGKAIRAKLALDEVPYDGIVFKNQLQNIVRGKFHNLREQVGFKLGELLRSRIALAPTAEEVLFGDDWESDALTYSIYADTLAGHISLRDLRDLLTRFRVDLKNLEEVLTLASAVPRADGVRRIFVNLERRTPPANFRALGPRVVPTFNYLQTAAVLCADGYLDSGAVSRVAHSLIQDAGYTPERLMNSLSDLCRRGHLTQVDEFLIRGRLAQAGQVPESFRPRGLERARVWARLAVRRFGRTQGRHPTGAISGGKVDYAAVVDEWEEMR